MTIYSDFSYAKADDGSLTISMSPPVSVSGWDVRFDLMKRLGGQPLVSRYAYSGFMGLSGISVLNGLQGTFQIQILGTDTSGYPVQNYAWQFFRVNSGYHDLLAEGFDVERP